MKKYWLIGISMALGAGSGVALAADATNKAAGALPPSTQQQAPDTSKVGKTAAEANKATGGALDFARLDVDRNGSISKTEAGSTPGLPDQFGKLDKNGDGNLTKDEAQGFVASNAANAKKQAGGSGASSDGTIGVGQGDNAAAVNPQAGKAAGSLSTGQQSFGSLDANGDGKLTKQEVSGNAEISSSFARIDANKDGKLDSQEFTAGLKATPPAPPG